MRNFYYLCTLLLIMIISSCKTATKVVEIPVETIKKEYINSIKIDSVYVRDSIDRWQKGDTLYITKWHTKFQYINKVDTILKTDTIPKVITVEKQVEVNHIYWWQKSLMYIGVLVVIILLSIIGFKLYKLVRK